MVNRYIQFGSSVRATMALVLASKARALLLGRYHVNEEDLRSLAGPVLRHRILVNYIAQSESVDADQVLDDLIQQVKLD